MKWLKNNFIWIVVSIAVLVLIAVFFAPLLVGMARDMWQWALSETRIY